MAAPRLLVSNDDGINAQGLQALVHALEPLGEVWVVAPEVEQSAASHALSLHRPLRVKKLAERRFAIDGTPADCVYMAVNHLMKEARPAMVLSGINHGPNLADDVIYSGTVAAAMEGSLLGVPSIAFSLATRRTFEFQAAAEFAGSLVKASLAVTLPPRMLLNVNIPAYPPLRGYEITRLGRHTYGMDVVEKDDPRGRKYYWIGGTGYEHEPEPGTDVTAVHDHRAVSITPIMLDLTEHGMLEPLKKWDVPGFPRLDPLTVRIVAALLLASGCATTSATLPRLGAHLEPELIVVRHRVEKGQTLYRIAKAYDLTVDELMEANQLSDPRELKVGEELFIPGVSAPRPVNDADSPEPEPQGASSAPSAEKRPPSKPVKVGRATGVLQWPLRGVLYAKFGKKGSEPHDGIDLSAPGGTPVKTAAPGTVLFAGEQAGYGLIAIVEHDGGLITLYAHNRDLRVRTGQKVREGQVVATVGDSGRTSGPHLHFEVRKEGVPVDPLDYLGPVPATP